MILSTMPAGTWLTAVLLFQTGSVPIWVPLLIILIVILMFWWGLTRNSIPEEEPAEEHEVDHEEAPTETESDVVDNEEEPKQVDQSGQEAPEDQAITEEAEGPGETDDLTKIEGIGPKIASILANAGINTYAQLADMDVAELEKIVREDAGIEFANPESWPDQAALAASGDLDKLQELQNRLIAGRQRD